MPYFKWYALDQAGKVRSGRALARSQEALARSIEKQGIVQLVACREIAYRVSVSQQERAQFFATMADLLAGGVHMHEALTVAIASCGNVSFKAVLTDCREAVQEGVSIGTACSYYSELFTPFACQMLIAGQEAGALSRICKSLEQYFTGLEVYARNVRSALMMPLVTCGGFLVIAGLVFCVVIPRFAAILSSLNKPLPWRTQVVIHMSSMIASVHPLMLLSSFAMAILGVWWLMRRVSRTIWYERLCLVLPVVGPLIKARAAALFLRTLGVLLEGGVPMIEALSFAGAVVSPRILRDRYSAAEKAIRAGSPLLDALQDAGVEVMPAAQAMLGVGEATGALGPLLVRSADMYQQQFFSQVALLSATVQPLLVVVLGCATALIIFSLYEPIFSLGLLVE